MVRYNVLKSPEFRNELETFPLQLKTYMILHARSSLEALMNSLTSTALGLATFNELFEDGTIQNGMSFV
jgi:hypothetical protein